MGLEVFQQKGGSPVGDEFDDGVSTDPDEQSVAPEGTEGGEAEPAPTEETSPVQEQEPETEPVAEDPALRLRNENAALRSSMRQQARELAKMQAQFERLNKMFESQSKAREEETNFFSNEETSQKESTKEPELSMTEQYDYALRQLANERAPMFEVMLDTMELSPKYSDVREVCTQARVDELTDAMAQHIASRENRDPVEVQLQIEYEIWSKPQPFKYLYNTIKQYHPDYAQQTQKPAGTTPVPGGGREPKPASAPTSVMDVGGGSKENVAGWTAKRIDEMPEDDLHKVPGDVYQKYLTGQLD